MKNKTLNIKSVIDMIRKLIFKCIFFSILQTLIIWYNTKLVVPR